MLSCVLQDKMICVGRKSAPVRPICKEAECGEGVRSVVDYSSTSLLCCDWASRQELKIKRRMIFEKSHPDNLNLQLQKTNQGQRSRKLKSLSITSKRRNNWSVPGQFRFSCSWISIKPFVFQRYFNVNEEYSL